MSETKGVQFTESELKKGVSILKREGYYEMVKNFAIPKEWHTQSTVPCLDELKLEKKITFIYQEDEYGEENVFLSEVLMKEFDYEFTCSSMAKYIYALFMYVQTGTYIGMTFKGPSLASQCHCDKVECLEILSNCSCFCHEEK